LSHADVGAAKILAVGEGRGRARRIWPDWMKARCEGGAEACCAPVEIAGVGGGGGMESRRERGTRAREREGKQIERVEKVDQLEGKL
jgi:hypothetical protein